MSTELIWFKSSYSNSGGGECLEVAHAYRESSRAVHVRDSKLGARSSRFAVPADAWNAFLAYASREA
ncbi:DUF397 domain-containing protein [Streptomyces sp. NPDC051104]|uniref:DUF397 domain-containing protein n=1 Tax=Streptomyces sp. NPDC051104 TaxID=3155044 RepID=UPI003412771F